MCTLIPHVGLAGVKQTKADSMIPSSSSSGKADLADDKSANTAAGRISRTMLSLAEGTLEVSKLRSRADTGTSCMSC